MADHLRIGTVPFINVLPLTRYLKQFLPDAEVSAHFPSQLVDLLARGEIHAALLSSITYPRLYPNVYLLPEMGIASTGAVSSVNLFFPRDTLLADRVPRLPHEKGILTDFGPIALDPASRSSNNLLRILVQHDFANTQVEFKTPTLGTPIEQRLANHQSALAIGDLALTWGDKLPYWDLGQWWYQRFNLPFVYALWQIHHSIPYDRIAEPLTLAMEAGLAARNTIAQEACAEAKASTKDSPLDYDKIFNYLTRHIEYQLQASHLQGLKLYYQKCQQLGLIETLPPVPQAESF